MMGHYNFITTTFVVIMSKAVVVEPEERLKDKKVQWAHYCAQHTLKITWLIHQITEIYQM